ncbi:hypothetical protein [Streptomyces sp. ok210]|uniref:hypothetical protein n=1 Tax=Streptomyces sp. ok210 TaxID=1761905 RepID=UPI0008F16334|nr:hypothetical protein [Streptomyces sp. ok210]SFS34884.1 hypothetical protein SAMN04487982_101132 [Streptomyces sp. ok210]
MRLVARTGGAVAALSLGLAVVPAAPANAAVVHIGCNVEELRDAIDTANGAGGGTIDLAPKCTYTLTDANTVGSQNGFPAITTDITLKGGKRTVIERSSAPGTPEFRLFQVNAPDGELTLNRLTLRNGSTPFGGVALVFGSISVISSQLTGHHATIDGGAINGQPGSTITVTSSELVKNTAGSAGGGISSLGAVTLTHTEVSRNTAGFGGAVAVSGPVTFNHSKVNGNTATGAGGGGGVSLLGTTGTFDSTDVSRNKATGAGADGGGILGSGSSIINLRSSWVSGNSATDVGGGILSQQELNARRSTVQDNTAGIQGGGIWSGGTTRLDGTKLKGNRTTAAGSQGGGLFAGSGTATLIRSEVSRNRADGTGSDGGGIYEQPGSTVTIDRTKVANNHPNHCAPTGAVTGCVN